jgi:putative membrane protein
MAFRRKCTTVADVAQAKVRALKPRLTECLDHHGGSPDYTGHHGFSRRRSKPFMRLLLNWLLSAIALLVVSYFMPGFHVSGFGAALLAALVIGLANATLGLFLKVITFPLTILTLGIFWWVINALMLMFASAILSPRFVVTGFLPAFVGAVVLSLVNMLLKSIARDVERA